MTEKDAVGSSVKWLYGYDNRNHLIQVDRKTNGTTIDLTVKYTYDARGNRVQSSVDLDGPGINNARVTKFLLDGWNPGTGPAIGTENVSVWADQDIDGSLKTRYLRDDRVDGLLGRTDYTGAHTGQFWYVTDNIGSVRAVTDNYGAIVDAIAYDGYGNITTQTDADYRGRYTWSGREIEVEIGLQFNRARFYDPKMGRWISKDPMGFDAGDSNLYRYLNNSPTNGIDPSGLDAILLINRNGAAGFGHAALVVGSDKTGWTYYSYGEDTGSSDSSNSTGKTLVVSGGASGLVGLPEIGVPLMCTGASAVGTNHSPIVSLDLTNPDVARKLQTIDGNIRYAKFKTLNDAIVSPVTRPYTDFVYYRTSKDQDRVISDNMYNYRSKGYYLIGRNCGLTAVRSMREGNVPVEEATIPNDALSANRQEGYTDGKWPPQLPIQPRLVPELPPPLSVAEREKLREAFLNRANRNPFEFIDPINGRRFGFPALR